MALLSLLPLSGYWKQMLLRKGKSSMRSTAGKAQWDLVLSRGTVAVFPFVAAPFSAQSDIDPVPALSISYLRAFPGLDPVLSHPYKRQVYELEVI